MILTRKRLILLGPAARATRRYGKLGIFAGGVAVEQGPVAENAGAGRAGLGLLPGPGWQSDRDFFVWGSGLIGAVFEPCRASVGPGGDLRADVQRRPSPTAMRPTWS